MRENQSGVRKHGPRCLQHLNAEFYQHKCFLVVVSDNVGIPGSRCSNTPRAIKKKPLVHDLVTLINLSPPPLLKENEIIQAHTVHVPEHSILPIQREIEKTINYQVHDYRDNERTND